MTEQTIKVGFTITGEFVTEHARNLMIEDAWEEGYRFLQENIIGIDHEISIAILKGEKRLAGEVMVKKAQLSWTTSY